MDENNNNDQMLENQQTENHVDEGTPVENTPAGDSSEAVSSEAVSSDSVSSEAASSEAAETATDAYAPYTSTYATPAEAGKKGRGLKIAIAVIVGVLVLAIAGVGASYVFAKDYTVNLFKQMTMDPTEYYRWVKTKQTDENMNMYSEEVNKAYAEVGKTPEQFAGKASIGIEVADEVLAMIPDMPIKSIGKVGFDVDFAYADKQLAYGIGLNYKDTSLLTAKVLLDLAEKHLYAVLPEYDSRVVDLTGLTDGALDDLDINMLQEEFDTFKAEMSKYKYPTADEINAIMKKCSEASINSIENVTLEKGCEIELNGEKVKCTKAVYTYTGKQMAELSKTLIKIFRDDESIIRFVESAGKTKDEFQKLMDEGLESLEKENEVSGVTINVVDYIGSKSESLGCDLKIDVNSTKVGLDIRESHPEADTSVVDINVAVNSIEAAGIQVTTKNTDAAKEMKLVIKPNESLASLAKGMDIGEYLKYSLVIESKLTGNNEQSTSFAIVDGSKNMVKFSVDSSYSTENVKLPVDKNAADKVDISTEEGMQSYLNTNKLIGYVFGIYDRFDEPTLKSMLDEMLSTQVGMNIEGIRGLYKAGMFDDIDISSLLGGGGDDPYIDYEDPEDVTGEDTSGDDKIGSSNGVDTSRNYYYSASDLASYCKLGQYKGLTYSNGTTEESDPEQAKEAYIESLMPGLYYWNPDKQLEMGDECYADISLIFGGVSIDEYSFEDAYVVLGEDMYGKGLDEQLVGMKNGDSKIINVTLEGDMYGDFQGINADFNVTIKDIYEFVPAEWNEHFLIDACCFSSMEEAEEYVYGNSDSKISENEIRSLLLSEVKMNAGFYDFPAELIAKYREIYLPLFDELYMSYVDMSMEDYYINSLGYSKEDFLVDLDAIVESYMTDLAVTAAIAEAENIYLPGNMYSDMVDEALAEYGTYGAYDSFLDSYYTADEITDRFEQLTVDNYISKMVEELIYNNAVIE